MDTINEDVYNTYGIEGKQLSLDDCFKDDANKKDICVIKGKKYDNQVSALYSSVGVFWDYVVDNGVEYIKGNYFELLKKHFVEIEDNFDKLSKKFQNVLNDYLNSYLAFESACGLDIEFLTQFNGFCCVVKPDLRFLRGYKYKKLYHVLNFHKILELYEKEPNDAFFFTKEGKELVNLLKKPCLFLTLTQSPDKSALLTLLHYRDTYKNLYNNLRHLFKKYGLNMDFSVKGVELTKNFKLHIHILFLGVEFKDIFQLIEFKKDLEHILRLAGWGYVNDVAYVTNNYTFRILLKSKLDELKRCKYVSDVKVLKTFYLNYYDDFNNKKHALFHLVRFKYNHPNRYKDKYNSATKAINYILKYILKSASYEDVLEKLNDCKSTKELEKAVKLLNRWLKYNAYFWLTGVRKFAMSRKLSSLLKKFVSYTSQKRFYFFSNDEELKEFLKSKKIHVDVLPCDEDDFGKSNLWVNDISKIIDRYPSTVYGLYLSLNLPVSEFLKNLRFKEYKLLDKSFVMCLIASPPVRI